MLHLRTLLVLTLAGTCLLAGPAIHAQEITFFESFTDNAILQRDVSHPVWGWAKPNRSVQIVFDGETYSTTSDKEGRWEALLPPTPAGGPYTITALRGKKRAHIKDVYFGDVYLLGGQSNMEWRLDQSDTDGSRAKKIADPMIREIKVERTHSRIPLEHVSVDRRYGSGWKVGTAERIGTFSGVGSYFAHYIREQQDVPIGLLHSSWGGSRIEAWLDAESMGFPPSQTGKKEDMMHGAEGRKTFQAAFGNRKLPTEDQGVKAGWLNDQAKDADWPTMTLPTFWEAAGYPSIDGVFYFRKSFTLTAAQAGRAATLRLGAIDDGDLTYVNGKKVGETPNAYSEERIYQVDAGVLRPGENTIAIRVSDTGGGGGFSASPEAMYLETAGGRVNLAGEYRYNIGQFSVDTQPRSTPVILYNAMIAPFEGLPLAGVLWYQGESNAGQGDNLKYAGLKRKLVRQWRDHFTHPDTLPFYWVQLANFMDPVSTPNEPGWAVLRQGQTEATDLPRTGMAVISDIGEADDIHPRNKWEVGRRLSLFALRDVYGKDVNADSPQAIEAIHLFNEKSVAIVGFENIGEGLAVKSEERYPVLKGFTVQDEAGNWSFAAGLLVDRESVMIKHPEGKPIQRVRYNWANNPDGNLFSREGLPANGFDLEVQ